jgi:hypothetical protein
MITLQINPKPGIYRDGAEVGPYIIKIPISETLESVIKKYKYSAVESIEIISVEY